ncbi:uncharacterized protein UBRO_20902 [Ustilago bromivora]|uniref:Uncharacterized protein n=1 Tax=Ustilago bromivora TaxID=307758 RepID=A0A1K0GBE1_9BASI|nr:uncharacterized protein UBRO_20902 [Ustilago bromivora]
MRRWLLVRERELCQGDQGLTMRRKSSVEEVDTHHQEKRSTIRSSTPDARFRSFCTCFLRRPCDNEQMIADATHGMLQTQMNKFHADWALDLREEMFSALFVANGRPFEDTTAKSRRKAMTTVVYNKLQGRQSRQTES